MKFNNDGDYFNIDIDDIDIKKTLLNGGMIDDIFYLKDLNQRKMFLNTDIDQYSIADVVKNIMRINKEDIDLPIDKRTPILLYITSNGGEVDSGFELIDVILCSKTPVYTINLGYQYSMGFLIGIAGHKRFAMPNAKFLHHDGTDVIVNSGSKVRDQMKFNERQEDRIKKYVIKQTKITETEYDERSRQEWYLFADEAKDYGIVDCIIGQDCALDEVI